MTKIWFADFWPGFKPDDNFFIEILRRNLDVELDSCNPDLLFFSCFGTSHLKYQCRKIFYTGENVSPSQFICDGSLSFEATNFLTRNVRLPIYYLYDDITKLNNPTRSSSDLLNRKFCNFVYSNPHGYERNHFFHLLSQKQKVDSGGRHLNNINGSVDNKRHFVSQYKFTIAFENESNLEYTTEKIFEPLLENSLPIYWGNPLVTKDFAKDSYINAHDFGSLEDLAQHVLQVHQNDELYLSYFKNPTMTYSKDAIEVNFLKLVAIVLDSPQVSQPVTSRYLAYLYQSRRNIEKVRRKVSLKNHAKVSR